jgi:C-terminal processing protease CtpA/Prc
MLERLGRGLADFWPRRAYYPVSGPAKGAGPQTESKETTFMEDRKMNRSWTIAAAAAVLGAAALSLGLFLAVSKETRADDGTKDGAKKVQIVTLSADDSEADAEAALEDAKEAAQDADEEVHGAKGGYLGLSLREDTKSNEGGALVENVVGDSPADKAGIKKGDVIVGFGGDIVRGPAKVTEKLRAQKSGDKVVLDVRRDGKVQKMNVELGARRSYSWSGSWSLPPGNEEQEKALEKSLQGLDEKLPDMKLRLGNMKIYAPGRHGVMILGRSRPLLGIEMVETTPELREALGGSKDAGVLVGKVLAGSAAEKGGLKVGDLILSVDGEKVSDAGELGDVIGKHEGKAIDLDVVRDKRSVHVKAVLPKIDEPEDEPTGPRASLWRIPAFAPPAPPPAPAAAPRAVPAPPAPPAPPRVLALCV